MNNQQISFEELTPAMQECILQALWLGRIQVDKNNPLFTEDVLAALKEHGLLDESNLLTTLAPKITPPPSEAWLKEKQRELGRIERKLDQIVHYRTRDLATVRKELNRIGEMLGKGGGDSE